MVQFFKPLIVNVGEKDPYANNPTYQISDQKVKYKNHEKVERIIYQKEHGFLWQIGQLALAFMATVSLVSLALDFKGVIKLWQRGATGEEQVKVIKKIALKSIMKKPNEPKDHSKNVTFDKNVDNKTFSKEDPPKQVKKEDLFSSNLAEDKSSFEIVVKEDVNPPKSALKKHTTEKTDKKVNFKESRARDFEKNEAPKEVGNQNSITLEDLSD